MSQQICYIITPIEVKVPIDIVHFKEKNCTVIPLLIDDNDFEKLVFSSSDSSTISEFMESAIIHLIYEYPTRKAFEFITNAKIETFGIVYYYGHFFVLEDTKPVLFINDKRIDIPWDNFENEIHQRLESQCSFSELINNEVRYRSFYDAEEFYFKELEKKCNY